MRHYGCSVRISKAETMKELDLIKQCMENAQIFVVLYAK